MATSLARLITLSLAPRGSPPWRPFLAAVARVDALLRAAIRARRPGARGARGARRADRRRRERGRAARPGRHAARRRARDDRRLARLGARAARAPSRTSLARLRDGDDAYLEATVKEVLRTRPVLSITPRKVRRAVRGRRLDAAAGRARHAVPLPRPPPPRAVAGPDRVPARALPRRRPAAVRVAAVRRRRAPLRRRRVRDDGAARGAARGRPPLRPAARPRRGRAHAPPRRHADSRARRAHHPASVSPSAP